MFTEQQQLVLAADVAQWLNVSKTTTGNLKGKRTSEWREKLQIEQNKKRPITTNKLKSDVT